MMSILNAAFRKAILGLACVCMSFSASADQIVGKLSGYLVSDSGGAELLLIRLTNAEVSGCNSTGRFALRSSTGNHYKATVAAILAAYHSQTDVTVTFTKTCQHWGNAHDMQYVCIGSIPC